MAPMSCLSLLISAAICFSISLPKAAAAPFVLPVRFEGALEQKTKDSSLTLQKLRVMEPYEKIEIEFE